MTNAKTLDHAQLAQFTGSETWYRHGLVRRVLYTEGAKYVADRAGAYWLLDEIAIGQMEPTIRATEFQVWKLQVSDHNTATLTVEDGNDNKVSEKVIEFTDFPAPGITLWCTGNTIMLPSEY